MNENFVNNFNNAINLTTSLGTENELNNDTESRLMLKNMPHHIKQDILEQLDFQSLNMLRKTSAEYKNVVENCTYPLNDLCILCNKYRLIHVFNDRNDIDVKIENTVTNGCVIIEKDTAFYKKKDNRNVISDVIRTLLRCANFKISDFNIYQKTDRCEEGWFSTVLENIHNVLSSLKQPLKVENLRMDIERISDLLLVIPCLEPKFLETIVIGMGRCLFDGNETMQELSKTEQWKNAKHFFTRLMFNDDHFHVHFCHFEYALFLLWHKNFTLEKLLKMKDALLLQPKLNQIKICIALLQPLADEVNRTLGTYNSEDIQNPYWKYYQYPNSENYLSMRVKHNSIMFTGPCYIETQFDHLDNLYHQKFVNHLNLSSISCGNGEATSGNIQYNVLRFENPQQFGEQFFIRGSV